MGYVSAGDEVMLSDGTGAAWIVVALSTDGWADLRCAGAYNTIRVSAVDASWPPPRALVMPSWRNGYSPGYRFACEPRWAREEREQQQAAVRRAFRKQARAMLTPARRMSWIAE